jgi:hypothetical protein
LVIEAVVIAALLALAAFLIYHFTVRTIRNTRPLGGANVNVTHGQSAQSEASFAIDPANPQVLFGASNQLFTYRTTNSGRTWHKEAGPVVHEPVCVRGEPHTAFGKQREYLAFLASPTCSDQLTPFLVVTSRVPTARAWEPVTRVAPPKWPYGYDDAPSLALDQRSGRVYLTWTRSLSEQASAIVLSASDDAGHTWSPPVTVAPAAAAPHLSTVAVGPTGDVYVAGIDARHGVWIVRSTDHGKTFGEVRTVAPLRANPSSNCAGQVNYSPLPTEETSCIGPNPTVLATKTGVVVVYDDVGANRTPDVYVTMLDSGLRPRFNVQVNPPDKGSTQQFFPAGAVDASTGVLWACWYDTTFDPNAHRAWFTCAASRDGRTWTPPERAAAAPVMVNDLYTDLRGSTGFAPAVVADRGVAHAFWIGVNAVDFGQDIYTAALSERKAFLTLQR